MVLKPDLSIQWEKVYSELVDLFREYLRINTTNPPGNEIQAAEFFKNLFDREGIENTIYESVPGRGSILAILKGAGKKRPLVLLNHMDVVPVEQEKWDYPAFEAIEDDGFIYARGAIDMKSFGILEAMALILLKRTGFVPNRDLVFLGTADEEVGGVFGMDYLVKQIPWLRDVEFCMNEGGSIRETSTGQQIWEVAFSEKVPSRFYVRASGAPGHGSVPHGDSCTVKLVEALTRLNAWKTPVEILPAVRREIHARAKREDEPLKSILENIDESIKDPEVVKVLEEEYPTYNAMIRDTHTLTVLHGGSKGNVIPSEAYAMYDARILPGHSREKFIEQVREVVKGLDVIIEAEDPGRPAPESILEKEDSEFFRTVTKVAGEMNPGAEVIPTLMLGASDSQYFRNIGVPSYGFAPFVYSESELHRIHGHNERISIENMQAGIKTLYRILELLAGKE